MARGKKAWKMDAGSESVEMLLKKEDAESDDFEMLLKREDAEGGRFEMLLKKEDNEMAGENRGYLGDDEREDGSGDESEGWWSNSWNEEKTPRGKDKARRRRRRRANMDGEDEGSSSSAEGERKRSPIPGWDPVSESSSESEELEPVANRLFDVFVARDHRLVPDSERVVWNADARVTQFRVRDPETEVVEVDPASVVLHIHGALLVEGELGEADYRRTAAWAVVAGPPGCPYNKSGLVEESQPQTANRALFEAMRRAVEMAEKAHKASPALKKFYIRSDSDYLVNAMTITIHPWIRNEGRHATNESVADWDFIIGTHERMDILTFGPDELEFSFEYIKEDRNQEARALALHEFNYINETRRRMTFFLPGEWRAFVEASIAAESDSSRTLFGLEL